MSNYNLQRFINAQDNNNSYARALQEIRRGQKTGHWIWYIFPQLAGFGFSYMATTYAISNIEEAKQYLANPTLYKRLKEITEAVLSHRGGDIIRIMGSGIDAIKLRSSMTLFWCASRQLNEEQKGDPIFYDVIKTFYNGTFDDKTVAKLNSQMKSEK
ncbi:MAG: DUF1810 domain-containing protein [Bacteroidaceae bacterium]|nr:DUF1810 domain-containing protein [Bacteroidaceae bacterium]